MRPTRRQVQRRRKAVGLAIAIVAILVVFILALTLFSPGPQDPETLCSLDEDYPHTAIVIDSTDPLSESQVYKATQLILDLVGEFAVGEWVGIYRVHQSNLFLPELEWERCFRGDGTKANIVFETPGRIRREFESEFRQPIEDKLNRLLRSPPAGSSPILEVVKAIAEDPKFTPVEPRRLVIISDMLHHTESYSHYQDGTDYTEWSSSEVAQGFLNVRLDGTEVQIFYIKRMSNHETPLQSRAHVLFWETYFSSIGAKVTKIEPIQ